MGLPPETRQSVGALTIGISHVMYLLMLVWLLLAERLKLHHLRSRLESCMQACSRKTMWSVGFNQTCMEKGQDTVANERPRFLCPAQCPLSFAVMGSYRCGDRGKEAVLAFSARFKFEFKDPARSSWLP